jgi:cytochrome c oxidase accessory protein FixG
VSKHGLWLLIGVATGGAWVFYFADAPTLLADVVTLQAPAVAYFTIAILTATTYTFGGLMREQVCTYMCPWPRIQSAMLDEHSLTVTYNDWRGEPRSRHAKKMAAAGKAVGDCVDCNACVAACPMGIDIRDGQQLECITCALCIDACDDVMDRLGKERGLISYATLNDYNHNMMLASGGGATIDPKAVRDPLTGRLVAGVRHTSWRSIIRPRTLAYGALLAVIGLAMLTVLSLRSPVAVGLTHDRNPRYVLLQDGSVRNGYDVNILNMTPQPRTMKLTLSGLPGGAMSLADSRGVAESELLLEVEPDKALPLRLYVRANPDDLAQGSTRFELVLESEDGVRVATPANFETPEARR